MSAQPLFLQNFSSLRIAYRKKKACVEKKRIDYYPSGMAMPGRQIIGGVPYRYGYQGEFAETDPETGKPAFQLRIYDPRINRWLSPDPARQYHSPYMSMDNRWNMSVDPTGGCIKDGVDCTPDSDGFATDGGGNLWFWDGEAFNTEFSFGLNEISLTAQTSNHARIMANPVVQAIHAGQREWKGELQALAIVMAAPVALPGLLFAGEFALPYAPQALSATRTAFTISRTGAATRFGYSASEEVFSSISQTGGLGNVNAINILGNTFMPNIGGRLLTSTIDLNYNKGFKINSFDKSIINFGVGRLNDRLH